MRSTTLLNPHTLVRLAKYSPRLVSPHVPPLSPAPQLVSPLLFTGAAATAAFNCQVPVRILCSSIPTPSSAVQQSLSPLPCLTDRHNGVTVDLAQLPADTEKPEFLETLKASLATWRQEGKVAVWLKVPIQFSHLINVAAGQGFVFHHAEGTQAMLKLWLPKDKQDMTPQFATHQVGVSGVVLREDTGELLVVQDKNRPFTLWKFPGGLADLGENIASTAVREVFEETGVETEFQSVLAFRQQHTQPGAFGRSDLYFLCRLRPLTYELRPCSEEIRRCCWMTLEQLRREVDTSTITVRITDLVSRGLEEGFDAVDIVSEEHQSGEGHLNKSMVCHTGRLKAGEVKLTVTGDRSVVCVGYKGYCPLDI